MLPKIFLRCRTVLVFFGLLSWLDPGSALRAGAPASQTEANLVIELLFRSSLIRKEPANSVTLDVVFTDPAGHDFRVPAFWAGSNIWKVRYASPVVGVHKYRTECSEVKDQGLNGVRGQVEVKPYSGTNALYRHGPLRVSDNHRFFEHIDGTPFFWLADTWWMGLSRRLRWPEDFQRLAADRRAKGFNVIQIVAGLYPDMPPFDPRGMNEAGYPWEPDFTRIRPEYFDAADRRIRYLADQGFTPCLVGMWGYFLPKMGIAKVEAHWRYLIARYGAYPVVWCAAGEATMPWYLAEGFPYFAEDQRRGWTEVMRYIRATDPWHRLLTLHPSRSARLSVDDPAVLDFDMLQTPHLDNDAAATAEKSVRDSRAATPVMPVIDGEASYEGLMERVPTWKTREMFWVCLLNGAAGHTYGANGIWQVNRSDRPYGASPLGFNWGTTPWDVAMNLPGSRQEGLGKKMLEALPWQSFQPHPEWAAYARRSVPNLAGCQWIAYRDGGSPPKPAAPGWFFRRTFALPKDKTVVRAQLNVFSNASFTVHLNGVEFGRRAPSPAGKRYEDLPHLLKAGANVLAISVENRMPAPSDASRLIADLEIQFSEGEPLRLGSDSAWLCASGELPSPFASLRAFLPHRAGEAARGPEWDEVGFDDSTWSKAWAIGRYGEARWGKVEWPDDTLYEPQSAGIPGVVRVVYVPASQPIQVIELGKNMDYAVGIFDPVSGVKSALAPIHTGQDEKWTFPPPAGQNHDWVLILKALSPVREHRRRPIY